MQLLPVYSTLKLQLIKCVCELEITHTNMYVNRQVNSTPSSWANHTSHRRWRCISTATWKHGFMFYDNKIFKSHIELGYKTNCWLKTSKQAHGRFLVSDWLHVTSSPGRTTFIHIWWFEQHLLRFNHIYSSTTTSNNNNNTTTNICIAIKWTNHSCPSLQVGGS